MAKDHYLPAALIGRFSNETTSPARDRRIYVARADKVFAAKAESVGYVKDLYTLDPTGPPAPDVDRIVSGYEPNLPTALDLLERSSPVPLKVWLRTLVPWAASLFVRGADFGPRYSRRLRREFGAAWDVADNPLNTPDVGNLARSLELQRLLAPVMAARWLVLHRRGGEPFVINDLGVGAVEDPDTGEWGYALPLSHSSVLAILPKLSRAVAHYCSGSWWAVVEHEPYEDPDGTRTANNYAARAASEFVAAADLVVAERLRSVVASHSAQSEVLERWPFNSWTRRHHEHEWHRLVGATSNDPAPEAIGDLQVLTFAGLDEGWAPMIHIGANLREMPTGLQRTGNLIRLTMTELANYGDFLITPDEDARAATDARYGAARAAASPELGWYWVPLPTR